MVTQSNRSEKKEVRILVAVWKSINLNKQNIESTTARAILVKMPNNSVYSGYKFWHPAKLVREGKHIGSVSLSYTDDFVFKLFKNGEGKHNKFEKVAEDEIDVDDFEEAFGVVNSSICSPEKGYVKVVEPKFIKPKASDVDESLKL